MINRRLAYIIRDQAPLLTRGNETVQAASKAMRERHVGTVLVVDDREHLLGLFTGRDALKLLGKGQGGNAALAQPMKPNPVSTTPDHKAIDALRAMSDGGSRHLQVVERERSWRIASRADFKGIEIDWLDEEEGLQSAYVENWGRLQ
jgi:CBS domain-containing protein